MMRYEEFLEKFHITPNTQQAEAIRSVKGHVLLLAVPGSGKTTTMVSRLGYMIFCENISPKKILTITFSKDATEDMEKRFYSIFGEDLKGTLVFRTINSLSLGLVNYYRKSFAPDYPELFLIPDLDKKKVLANLFYKSEGSFPLESEINAVETAISNKKNRMISDDNLAEYSRNFDFNFKEIYKGYQEYLQKTGRMDFDDQMVLAYDILRSDKEFLSRCQSQYEYISVDEAQDTSKIQYEIIRMLAEKHGNLFMVGDEDQSIYGFRGAEPKILLDFEKNYPDTKVLFSEQNYRSTQEICKTAQSFIEKNIDRKKKVIRAVREEQGVPVKEIRLPDDNQQYIYLLNVAKTRPENTAVLFRDNDSVLPLLDLFNRKGVPYKFGSGKKPAFINRIIQDYIDILSFAFSPEDTELFKKVVYKLDLHVEKNFVEKACKYSREWHRPVLGTLAYLTREVRPKISVQASETEKQLSYATKTDGKTVYALILNNCGYRRYLTSKKKCDFFKLRNLELLSVSCPSSFLFLQYLTGLDDIVHESKEDNCLILSTMHASKGREFDEVYLMDVIDGKCPSCENGEENYEEERRIFYVAMTRAKNKLCIFTYNHNKGDMPCSFSSEVFGWKPTNTVKKPTHVVVQRPVKRTTVPLPVVHSTPPPFRYTIDISEYGVGQKVEHYKYGVGTVTQVSTEKDSAKILFSDGERTLALEFSVRKGMLKRV